MLSKREAFKVAFLLKCAELGLTLEETHQLVKTARADLREKRAVGWWDTAKGNLPGLGAAEAGISGLARGLGGALGGGLINAGLLAAIGIPLAAGGAVGYGLGKAQDLNDRDPHEVRMEETRDALRRAARRARMQTVSRQRKERQRPTRPLI